MNPSELSVPVQEGEVLAGKYRVDRVLGAGGMGVVVAATHIELGQRVAIKFLRSAALNVPGSRERFTREARAAATLQSDHVARVVDVGSLDDGAPYMIMEFLDGCDLGQLLARQGPLRIDEAVGFVIQACDAVSEAHAVGIIHRDLKPGNLFLTRKPNGTPHIKVLDFGISKSTNVGGEDFSLTKTSDVIGSPIYMAPEQIRSARDVDQRTDIWALGVILYELLTGQVPFPAQNVPQLCALVLEKEPRPIAELRPDIPFELAAIIKRCLAKSPDDRFSSIGELMRALFAFGPAPAAQGLTRSVAPGSEAARSATIGSLERPSQEWGETIVGPHPPAGSPRIIAASSPARLEPSGSGGASLTLPSGAATGSKRLATVGIIAVALLVGAGAALTAAGLWVFHRQPPLEPTASSLVPPAPSAPLQPAASLSVPSARAEVAVSAAPPDIPTASEATPQPPRPPRGTPASTRTSAPDGSPPPHATAAPPAGTPTTPPTGDFLPDERK